MVRIQFPILVVLVGCGGVSTEDGGLDPDANPDPNTLTIVASSPSFGASSVEKDEPLVLEFSAVLDETTVSDSTVVVSAAGRAVAGSLTASGATLTFTPDVQWHLAATIDVTVSDELRGVDGEELSAPYASQFDVRDGQWSAPAVVATNVAGFSAGASNLAGDIIFPFETTSDDISVLRFDATTQQFAVPELVENQVTPFISPIAALNEDGDAIVVWRSDDASLFGWSLFDGGWSPARTQNLSIRNSRPGLALDGTAVAVYRDGNVLGSESRFVRLAPGSNTWTAPAVAQANSVVWAVRATGSAIQAIFEPDSGGLVSRELASGAGSFGPAKTISAGGDANFIHHSALGGGDMSFSWMQNGNEIAYSKYSAAADAWSGETLGAGTGGSQVCENAAGVRVGVYQSGGLRLARVAGEGEAFGLAENIGAQAGVEFAGCFIDDFGQAHGLWAGFGGGVVSWARLDRDGNWSTPISLGSDTALRSWHNDRFGNLTILSVENGQASVRRFE